MKPETRAFLDSIRSSEDPTAEDERRVLAAVRVSLATGATFGVGLGASKASKALNVAGIPGAKLAILALCAAAATGDGRSARLHVAPIATLSDPILAASANELSAEGGNEGPTAPPSNSVKLRPLTGGARKPVTPKPAVHGKPIPSLRAEIQLLKGVQRALRGGNAGRALAMLDRHQTNDRQLAAERDAARIRALCALGRIDEARRAAAALTKAHPQSVQVAALKSCASPDLDSGDLER